MNSNTTSKCDNCGAGLKEFNGQLHCAYCGSVFHNKPLTPEAKPENKPTKQLEVEPTKQPENLKGATIDLGCLIGFFVFIVIGGILFGLSRNNSSNYDSYADSLSTFGVTIDTTKIEDSTEVSVTDEKTEALNGKLAQLKSITITKAAFKSLYRNTRKKYDEFSKSTDIYDKGSPRYVNYSGVFVYITKMADDIELRLKMQYLDTEWLNISEVIFNTDGENHTYSSWKFARGSTNEERWEWYDTNLTDAPSTLLALATAKSAKVKYNGDEYYKIVVITKKQQAAIKRQLQVYKGLLLGYNK